ncbi:hypothetical protein GCM10011320_03730 [Neoroseomonas lacus]|uniref:Tetratricopeptide repeat protein n=1 Tax=Neoroseomonas lacus TaxID=287609 RepID=A0A917NH66_9PROT|nr:hypothetical protein GCM10011320_03730 [Neoroseomonas lacus]
MAQYPRRISYGFSMGGYGAIKHSRILGATHVLAMSPQWSIRPDVAPWERRYLHFLDECVENMEVVKDDCGGKIYLIYDDMNSDSHHAKRIAAATDIIEIPASLAGHDTWALFLSSATMRALFDAIFADDVSRIYRIVRERRRLLPDLETRILWARARRYFRLKRLDEAERAARRADRLTARVPGAAWLLTAILIEMNRPEEAETVIRLEMERFPTIRWLGIHLVKALESQGRLRDALDALAPMLASQPHRSDLKRSADHITRKLHAQGGRIAAIPPRPDRTSDGGPVWSKAGGSSPAVGTPQARD